MEELQREGARGERRCVPVNPVSGGGTLVMPGWYTCDAPVSARVVPVPEPVQAVLAGRKWGPEKGCIC